MQCSLRYRFIVVVCSFTGATVNSLHSADFGVFVANLHMCYWFVMKTPLFRLSSNLEQQIVVL